MGPFSKPFSWSLNLHAQLTQYPFLFKVSISPWIIEFDWVSNWRTTNFFRLKILRFLSRHQKISRHWTWLGQRMHAGNWCLVSKFLKKNVKLRCKFKSEHFNIFLSIVWSPNEAVKVGETEYTLTSHMCSVFDQFLLSFSDCKVRFRAGPSLIRVL